MQMKPLPLEKRCPICKQIKNLEAFPVQTSGRHGKAFACKPCHREYMRNNARKNYTVEKEELKILSGSTISAKTTMTHCFVPKAGYVAHVGDQKQKEIGELAQSKISTLTVVMQQSG
jgi:hypothetical protein